MSAEVEALHVLGGIVLLAAFWFGATLTANSSVSSDQACEQGASHACQADR